MLHCHIATAVAGYAYLLLACSLILAALCTNGFSTSANLSKHCQNGSCLLLQTMLCAPERLTIQAVLQQTQVLASAIAALHPKVLQLILLARSSFLP